MKILLLLLLVACGPKKPVPEAPVPDAAPAAPVEMAPTPYTADQIRDAMPVGTVIEYRIEEAGSPPVIQRWTVTAADATTGTMAEAIVDDAGTVLEEKATETSTWEDLRKHAEFPAARTTRSDSEVEVPAGKFATWLYVVENPKLGVTSYFEFAKEMPGPPVKMAVKQGMTTVYAITLLERTSPVAP
jgi:hypothetical protein